MKIHLTQDELRKALEHYFENVLLQIPVTVTSVKKDTDNTQILHVIVETSPEIPEESVR